MFQMGTKAGWCRAVGLGSTVRFGRSSSWPPTIVLFRFVVRDGGAFGINIWD